MFLVGVVRRWGLNLVTAGFGRSREGLCDSRGGRGVGGDRGLVDIGFWLVRFVLLRAWVNKRSTLRVQKGGGPVRGQGKGDKTCMPPLAKLDSEVVVDR